MILPWRKRISKRYFLTKNIKKYHPLLSTNYFKHKTKVLNFNKKKGKKFSPYRSISLLIKLRKAKKYHTIKNKSQLKKRYHSIFFKTMVKETSVTTNLYKKIKKNNSSPVINTKLFQEEQKKKKNSKQ